MCRADVMCRCPHHDFALISSLVGSTSSGRMRAPSSSAALSRLAFRSIEFSSSLPLADLASVPSPPSHYILPHLPSIVTAETKADFQLHTASRVDAGDDHLLCQDYSKPRPIMTMAASLFEDSASLIEAARERIEGYGADTLLIVGGNERTEKSLKSSDAIGILSESFPTENLSLFCAWDPNSRDLDPLMKKIDAGATGVITQPLLTKSAWDQLDMCQSEAVFDENMKLIPGLALPKSSKTLLFWSSLLKESSNTIQKDDGFAQSLRYFESLDFDETDRIAWSMEQRDRLLSYAIIHGLHFMPLGNKGDLLQLLR